MESVEISDPVDHPDSQAHHLLLETVEQLRSLAPKRQRIFATLGLGQIPAFHLVGFLLGV